MNREGPVWRFCERLWKLRSAGTTAVSVTEIGRQLSMAIAEHVVQVERYDPEDDVRVKWARAVVASVRRGEHPARASVDQEAAMEFLMIPSGKLLAAGDLVPSER